MNNYFLYGETCGVFIVFLVIWAGLCMGEAWDDFSICGFCGQVWNCCWLFLFACLH